MLEEKVKVKTCGIQLDYNNEFAGYLVHLPNSSTVMYQKGMLLEDPNVMLDMYILNLYNRLEDD